MMANHFLLLIIPLISVSPVQLEEAPIYLHMELISQRTIRSDVLPTHYIIHREEGVGSYLVSCTLSSHSDSHCPCLYIPDDLFRYFWKNIKPYIDTLPAIAAYMHRIEIQWKNTPADSTEHKIFYYDVTENEEILAQSRNIYTMVTNLAASAPHKPGCDVYSSRERKIKLFLEWYDRYPNRGPQFLYAVKALNGSIPPEIQDSGGKIWIYAINLLPEDELTDEYLQRLIHSSKWEDVPERNVEKAKKILQKRREMAEEHKSDVLH
jgi:hypothetical protein